jgi:hypothetical protein
VPKETLIRQFAGALVLPECESCPDGYGLSLTVYFPGAIDGVRNGVGISTGEGGADQRHFVSALESKLEEGEPCCLRLGYEVRYDPRRTAKQNAETLAALLNGLAQGLAALPGVVTIQYHLIGFSAGGQVALNVAPRLWEAFARSPLPWCDLPGEDFQPVVPAEIDLVTIATPLGSSGNVVVYALSEIGGFFAFLGRGLLQLVSSDWVFNASIGEDDYGGSAPAGLCRYVAIVTADDFDESSGAEEDPCDDPRRLGDWQPRTLRMGRSDFAGVPLPPAPAGSPPTVPRHTLAPLAALRLYPGLLDATCSCIPTAAVEGGTSWQSDPCR